MTDVSDYVKAILQTIADPRGDLEINLTNLLVQMQQETIDFDDICDLVAYVALDDLDEAKGVAQRVKHDLQRLGVWYE